MNILTPELIAILSVGVALAALLFRAIRRIDTYRTEASADRRTFQATADADRRAFQTRADADRRAFQAAMDADRRAFQVAMDADRRAFQAAMDDFRREMLRLAERQSRLEGLQEAQAVGATAGS